MCGKVGRWMRDGQEGWVGEWVDRCLGGLLSGWKNGL